MNTRTITWAPGTDPKMDQLFDQLREKQYNNVDHRLWKNYSRENFLFAVALTIHFGDDGKAEVCSSIASRDCWPAGAYRILNRAWKTQHVRHSGAPATLGPRFGFSVQSQVEWLNTHTDHQLYFISRETDNWERWLVKQFRAYNLEFSTTNYKYLTCPNECDISCWQNIIYHGDARVLEQWKRQAPAESLLT